jgi:PPIC-type PPIASE domain
MKASHNSIHRFAWWLIPLTLVVSLLISGCSSTSTISSAASVGGKDIPMEKYLKLSRLQFELGRLQGSSTATWQTAEGRTALVNDNKAALTLLIDNALLDSEARQQKLDGQVSKQLDSQVSDFFKSVPSNLQPLVDQGIVTRDVVSDVFRQNLLSSLVLPQANIQTAHIHILSYASEDEANKAADQINKKTANWADLSAHSTDPASKTQGELTTIVPHVLPKELDNYVFHSKTKIDPTTQTIIHSSYGWSVVQVDALASVHLLQLSDSTSILPTINVSQQTIGVESYLYDAAHRAPVVVKVNWCNNIDGRSCPSLNTIDFTATSSGQ